MKDILTVTQVDELARRIADHTFYFLNTRAKIINCILSEESGQVQYSVLKTKFANDPPIKIDNFGEFIKNMLNEGLLHESHEDECMYYRIATSFLLRICQYQMQNGYLDQTKAPLLKVPVFVKGREVPMEKLEEYYKLGKLLADDSQLFANIDDPLYGVRLKTDEIIALHDEIKKLGLFNTA